MTDPLVVAGVATPSGLIAATVALNVHGRRLATSDGRNGSAVRIHPPESADPDATADFWRHMHGHGTSRRRRVLHGQGHLCWELHVIPGGPELYLWASASLRQWWELRDAVEAAWKGARAEEAPTLVVDPPEGIEPVWATTSFRLGRGHQHELLHAAGEAFGVAFVEHARKGMAPGELVVLQILARPSPLTKLPVDAMEGTSAAELLHVAIHATSKAPAPKAPTRGKAVLGPWWEVEIRLACAAERKSQAVQRLATLAATTGILSGANNLARRRHRFDPEDRRLTDPSIFNVDELAAVAGMPGAALLSGDARRQIPAPASITDKGRILGLSGGRRVAMPRRATWEHTLFSGTTGYGKTTSMNAAALSDIEQGLGVVLVDVAKGNQVDHILGLLPPGAEDRLCVIDTEDPTHAVGLNLLGGATGSDLAISNLLALFRAQSAGAWGQKQADALRGACGALAFVGSMGLGPAPTLFEVQALIDNEAFRQGVLDAIDDAPRGPVGSAVAAEGHRQFLMGLDGDGLEPLHNKLRNFLSYDTLKFVLGQSDARGGDPFDLLNPPAGEPGGIVLLRARKGGTGMASADLLSSVVVQRAWAQALRRPRTGETSLWLDEVRNLSGATGFLLDIAAEGREPRLALNLATQYTTQLHDDLREAIDGTVNNRVSFAQMRDQDAAAAAKLFAPDFTAADFRNLGRFRAAVRIGGPPHFTIDTEEMPAGSPKRRQECLDVSRERWARPKAEVEDEILARMRNPMAVLGGTSKGKGKTKAIRP